MENIVRIGKVSYVKDGMVSVIYEDRDDATTAPMPYFSPGSEYLKPEIGETVLTVHMSSGTSEGVVIGGLWNNDRKPPNDVIWSKEISDFSAEFDGETLTINAPKIILKSDNKEIDIDNL